MAFLTRLIWQESNFQPNAVSPAGARGIAQFMPATASARGLADPFDPESAIPKAAALLAEMRNQFGNLGLAAAAYNAGPGRVAHYVAGQADLPGETQDYVSIITHHSAEEWRGKDAAKLTDEAVFPDASCVQIVAKFRRAEPTLFAHSSFSAPWGVQISGSFNKAAALRQYQRAKAAYAAILGGVQPMVLAGRLRSRGFRPYYRVRAPAHVAPAGRGNVRQAGKGRRRLRRAAQRLSRSGDRAGWPRDRRGNTPARRRRDRRNAALKSGSLAIQPPRRARRSARRRRTGRRPSPRAGAGGAAAASARS